MRSVLFTAILCLFVLTACSSAPAPTATPVPPTAAPPTNPPANVSDSALSTPTVAASVLSALSDTFAGGLVGGAAVGGTGVAVGAGALLHAVRTNRHRIAVNRTDRITTSLKS